jgi:hypothetical protein
MSSSDARGTNYRKETINTAGAGAQTQCPDDVLPDFGFEDFDDDLLSVNSMNATDRESGFESPSPPDFGDLGDSHPMGGTERSLNVAQAGEQTQQQRPGFGSCGTAFDRMAYQLPSNIFVFGGNQSASNASGHNYSPSNLSGHPPHPINPDLPVFRPNPRTNRATDPSVQSQSLDKFTGVSKGGSGRAGSFDGGSSQGEPVDKRKAEESDGDGDEGIRNGFKRLNLTGGP